jgi:hypothetical protein
MLYVTGLQGARAGEGRQRRPENSVIAGPGMTPSGCVHCVSDQRASKHGFEFVPRCVNLDGTDDPLADSACRYRELNLAAANGSICLRLLSHRANARWRWDCRTHADPRALAYPRGQLLAAVPTHQTNS